MNSEIVITGEKQHKAWLNGVLPPVEKVRDGLWSIPVPLPNNSLRYVLAYAFEIPDGLVLVDTGWDTEESWHMLCKGLADIGYACEDVKTVVVTHIHPDHYGLAGKIRSVSGAKIILHHDDAVVLSSRYGDDIGQVITAMRGFLTVAGAPEASVIALSEASIGIKELVHFAEPDIILDHEESVLDIPSWDIVAIHTPGHTPGHIVLYDRKNKLMLSGDHVLPRITPTIALHVQQRENPLSDYLAALKKIQTFEVNEVLPGHEWRFRPLDLRVDELIGHHVARLQEVENIVSELHSCTAWSVATHLHWAHPWETLNDFMRRMAVGETMAHLVMLKEEGRVLCRQGKVWQWEISTRI